MLLNVTHTHIYIYICTHSYTLLRRGTFSTICIIQLTTRSRWKFRICTYTMIILYSFPLYTFLWPENDPQWPKHVVVSIISRIQDSCVLTYPTPSLLTAAKLANRSKINTSVNALWNKPAAKFQYTLCYYKQFWRLFWFVSHT